MPPGESLRPSTRISIIKLDHLPTPDERRDICASFEDEGYKEVRLMQVVTIPGNSVVFDVLASTDSNPYAETRR